MIPHCYVFIRRWRYELAKRCRQEEIRINNISIHIFSLGWLHYFVGENTLLPTWCSIYFPVYYLYLHMLSPLSSWSIHVNFPSSSLRLSLLFFKLVQLSQIVDPTSVNGEAIAKSIVWKFRHYFSWISWIVFDLYLNFLLSFDFIFHSIIVLDS